MNLSSLSRQALYSGTFIFCSRDSKFCIPMCIPASLGFQNSRYCKLKSKVTYVLGSAVGVGARLASILAVSDFYFGCQQWSFENTNIKSFAGKPFAKFSSLDSNIYINLAREFSMLCLVPQHLLVPFANCFYTRNKKFSVLVVNFLTSQIWSAYDQWRVSASAKACVLSAGETGSPTPCVSHVRISVAIVY